MDMCMAPHILVTTGHRHLISQINSSLHAHTYAHTCTQFIRTHTHTICMDTRHFLFYSLTAKTKRRILVALTQVKKVMGASVT